MVTAEDANEWNAMGSALRRKRQHQNDTNNTNLQQTFGPLVSECAEKQNELRW